VARATAVAMVIISSTVIDRVESWPRTTLAAESPTRSRSMPASSKIAAVGAS